MAPMSPIDEMTLATAARPRQAQAAVQASWNGDNPEEHSTSNPSVALPNGMDCLVCSPHQEWGGVLSDEPTEEPSVAKPDAIKEAALSYARMGWSLLPVAPAGKVPALKGWPEKASSDPKVISQWFNFNSSYNIGMATGEKSDNIVVIDLDVKPDRDINGLEVARCWQMSHGRWPKTVTARTGGGGKHYYFRIPHPVRNSVNDKIGVDVRGTGGQAILPPSVHPSGGVYAWENAPWDCTVADANDSVLMFIEHMATDEGKAVWFEKDEVLEGSRDNELFTACSSWQSRGLSDEVILEKAFAYNARAFKPPLSEEDVAKKVDNVTTRYEKGDSGIRNAGSHVFDHSRFAERMLNEKHMCFIDGAPAVWDGSCYRMGWREVEKAMIDINKSIKSNNGSEVTKYLSLTAPQVPAADERYIAFLNGVLDLADMTLQPMRPDLRIPNVIPHRWNPDARTDTVLRFLNDVSQGDADTMNNLMETIGLCMYRGTELGVCLVLKGEGSNGKSTYISLLHAVLGADNVITLDMKTIGERFQTVPLIGKLANLGDDISNETIRGSCIAIIKKIVTGEHISAEYKGGETVSFRPYATLVFSCNDMPELRDSSHGMLRRIHPVPFTAKFNATSPGFDLNMSKKLATEEACEAAIVLGVEALRGCIERKGLTPNRESRKLLYDIKLENDSVLCWAVEERGFGSSDQAAIVGRLIPEERAAYENWCDRSGIDPASAKMFAQRMNALFGTASKSATREFANGRKSVRVFGSR